MSDDLSRGRRNLTALSLFLLAAAGAAAAAPAAEPVGLDRAETIVSEVEKEAVKSAAPDFCFPEPFAENLARRLKTDAADVIPLMSSNTAGGDLLMAHVCRAVAAGSPDACGGLRGIPIVPTFSQMPSKSATHTFEFRCRANYLNVLMAKAVLARDGSFERLCLENEAVHPVFLAGRAKEGCRIFEETHYDPSACARLSPLLDAGATGCRESMRQLVGDESYCPEIPDAMNRELCLGAAAYRGALARGPRACGDSPVCRMMAAPDAGLCFLYDRRLRRVLCPALGRFEKLHAAAAQSQRLDEAEVLIRSGGGASDRDVAARADALAERVARLRAVLPAETGSPRKTP